MSRHSHNYSSPSLPTYVSDHAILIGLCVRSQVPSTLVQRLCTHVQKPMGVFPAEGILLIDDLNQNGNRTLFLHHLNMLAESSQIQPLESLLLVFVGRGSVGGSFKILLPDRLFGPEHWAEDRDWLEWRTLCEWLAPVRVKNLLVLLDTDGSRAAHSRETLQWLQRCDAEERGQKLLLAANRGTKVPWNEETSFHFTEALLEGLDSGGCRDYRGAVTADRLFPHLHERLNARHARGAANHSPMRLYWPEKPDAPMDLTVVQPRQALDEELQASLREGRCLVWVGGDWKERCAPKPFPPRSQWESIERKTWLEYVDQERVPGEGCQKLVDLRLSLFDTGVDSALERCCHESDHQFWFPEPGRVVPPLYPPLLVRLSGPIKTNKFVYSWEGLETRFEAFLDWFSQQEHWDSILVFGFPVEEAVARYWIKELSAYVSKCWLVFPHDEEHDKVAFFEDAGIELILSSESEVLHAIDYAMAGEDDDDKTGMPRVSFPRKKKPRVPAGQKAPNPYVGLRPFSREQQPLFYGRAGRNGQEGELRTLYTDVLRQRKVLLFGDAGVGKTSLLQAGLLPALEQNDGFRVFFSDSEEPLKAIAAQVADEPCFLTPPDPDNVFERLGFLSEQSGVPILICVDHIERALLREPPADIAPDPDATFDEAVLLKPKTFIDRFVEAVSALERAWPQGNWRLLVSIQKEHYILLRNFVKRGESRMAQSVFHYELLALEEEMAHQAVFSPLPEGVSIDPALWKRFRKDLRLRGADGELRYPPALLQLVCWQVFEEAHRCDETTLSLEHYKPVHGGPRWLERWLEEHILAQLPPETSLAAQDILASLCSLQRTPLMRPWRRLCDFLKKRHAEETLEKARTILIKLQLLKQQNLRGESHLTLTHQLVLEAVSPLFIEDLQTAEEAKDQLFERGEARRGVLDRKLLDKMEERVAYLERVHPKHQTELEAFREKSLRHYKQRRLLKISLSVFSFACVLFATVWIYTKFFSKPRSSNTPPPAHVAKKMILPDPIKVPKAPRRAPTLGNFRDSTQKSLVKALLETKGEQACKHLTSLFHLRKGKIQSLLRAVKPQARYTLQPKCLEGLNFRGIQLQGIVLKGSHFAGAILEKANLEGTNLQNTNLKGSNLQGANLKKADLRGANLRQARLDSASLEGANLQGADLRGAVLKNAKLDGSNWRLVLISHTQTSGLQQIFQKRKALCLSAEGDKDGEDGPAILCQRWYQNKSTPKPAACPASWDGVIVASRELEREGTCPAKLRESLALVQASCPPKNAAACDFGRACLSDTPASCVMLGTLYRDGGAGLKVDKTLASRFYERACKRDVQDGCHALAAILWEAKRPRRRNSRRAIRLWKKACDAKHGHACHALGQRYSQGLGVKLDPTRAVALYKQACENKVPRACTHLGALQEQGKGTKKNNDEARKSYQQACGQKDAFGCYSLARFTERVEKKNKAAARLYAKAKPMLAASCAHKSRSEGCALLADIYRRGVGTRRQEKKALQILQKACDANNPPGCKGLGDLYYHGHGVDKDFKQARKYYAIACKHNHAESCDNLGALHENGQGGRSSKRKARILYWKACRLGRGWGCNNLGDMYFYSGRRGRRKARRFYRRACNLGIQTACRRK